MSSTQDTIARIRSWASASGEPLRRLALQAGLHRNSLYGLHDDTWNPTAETLQRLEALIPADFRPTAEGEPDRAA